LLFADERIHARGQVTRLAYRTSWFHR
jgi:hypothetical protein